MKELAERMYSEALDRLHDAEILSCSLAKASDTDSIIRVLVLEVLIKCALLLSLGERQTGHDYHVLLERFSSADIDEILMHSTRRSSRAVDLSNVRKLLDAYKHVFLKARYYYEIRASQTHEQVAQAGLSWLERGALLEEADVVYYAAELESLINGLSGFIEARLKA